MRARWLFDAVRAYWVDVVADAGWENRGAELVACQGVVVHHTASNPGSDPAGDVNYIWHSSSNDLVPEYSSYISRSGTVYIGATGKTNNAGKGGPTSWAPLDSANGYGLSVVMANNGVGEPYPIVQQDAAVAVVAAMCDFGNIPIGNVVAHREWAPTRKIDPAGTSRYATGSAMWDMDAFRDDVANLIATGGEPDMTDEERAMLADTHQKMVELYLMMMTPGPYVDDMGNPMTPAWAGQIAAERARQIRDG